MERLILKRVSTVGSPEPDLKMAQFERIARVNSTILVNDAADLIGLSPRQMARRTKACFGLTPKAVLRRSRFLDLATAMRGFSTPSERDLAALRYYDQSHVTREFKRFTNMTPGVFQKTPTPLFTAGLKLRQESLFED
jgi:AraC-like DNA-binding protein